MALSPSDVILAISFATIALGWVYFRRWQVTRPPIGVFNLSDVAFMLSSVVVVPLLYLALPAWLLLGLMALGALSAVYLAAEPIVKTAWASWLLVVAAVLAEGWAALADPTGRWLVLVNDAVIVVAVVGVANLWAQSGMKARDAAILGGALCVYDLVATSLLPLMGDLMARVSLMPFGPVVAWADETTGPVAFIGMGDLLLGTMFPLVMRKAYGRPAGLVALALSGASIVAPSAIGLVYPVDLFPVMTVLGPAMVLQHLWWSRRAGPERTTWQYLRAEPTG